MSGLGYSHFEFTFSPFCIFQIRAQGVTFLVWFVTPVRQSSFHVFSFHRRVVARWIDPPSFVVVVTFVLLSDYYFDAGLLGSFFGSAEAGVALGGSFSSSSLSRFILMPEKTPVP
uniref:Uncharacterized protein n=1 Tax=Amphora coffeiformis TaxID=265554 RepID=A0A6S8N121_9STRA|mmetsp:Transcript_14441/g.27514  ORF Transcript_14441/g.27514 Transcript_14441/m.27514 type:complete len:115 (+) Transcript_14441:111-455(+)